jgi:Dyp-type peroxidase family
MTVVNKDDIQGLVARGYGSLPAARYLLLRIADAERARHALSRLAERVTDVPTRAESVVNVALTYDGLAALGIDEETLASFAFEFREGMAAPHRQAILGDLHENAPERWSWGGPDTAEVHLLLILLAADDVALQALEASVTAGWDPQSLERVTALDANVLRHPETGAFMEHFGFADGVSDVDVDGLHERVAPEERIKAGEFLLGYPNEYGLLTARPLVRSQRDPRRILPAANDEPGFSDLGRNGTYLVFRQLHQDVRRFWEVFDDASRTDAAADPAQRTWLAAKAVGRWPSGAPLVKAPHHDLPELHRDNDFGFHHEDPEGLACPIGAHIRRTNPRDSLGPAPGTEKSLAVNKLHRLLRRGRTYGEPLSASFDPDAMLATDGAGERGLHFICLNANIGRQFEFVQHTWANNPKFGGLYEETDPLIGVRQPPGALAAGAFTIPADPIRRRLTGLPHFVEVRGGAYFFMPGIRALRYLSEVE